ncbi:hypothetical protein GCM10010289_63600 [Streptomyces violascens]|uniref:Uncharacterized protein n=2 Tax=Streptomyces violascens TaxID=67381 RepID=A0ABQ3QSP7_9ACTN|nr:hypothetical protein GCM10010289_63600 [Streptomyces violascens]GHI40301.1 hypothetical protein Sviol_47090 [Streptomyces violascens]
MPTRADGRTGNARQIQRAPPTPGAHWTPAQVGTTAPAQKPDWPRCACGAPMEHLLTISASESCGRWLPTEERTRPGSGWEVRGHHEYEDNSHGMDMGDCGGVYVFLCRSCPGWPSAHRYDC